MESSPQFGKSPLYNLDLGIGNFNSARLGIGSVLPANSPIFAFGASMRQFTEAIDNLLKPQRIMRDIMESWAKQHQKMVEDIAKMATLTIPKLPIATLPNAAVTENRPVLEGEIVGPIVQPRPTPLVKVGRQYQKMGFGLHFVAGNSVQFNRKTLRALPLDTQHGKLLEMFLMADGHFVSDDELLEAFNKYTIHDISHIRRNLKPSTPR